MIAPGSAAPVVAPQPVAPAQPGTPPQPAANVQPSQANVKHDFDNYVAKATTLIHSPETTGAIQNMLTGADPVSKVAAATVMIMQRLDAAARAAGVEVQDTVKVYGAADIVNQVAELGEAAGKFGRLPPKLIELALSVAVQDYVKGEIAAGRIDGQKLQAQMQQDMAKIPQKERQEIQAAQVRILQTARQYNGGK
jgi:hypothetical protein